MSTRLRFRRRQTVKTRRLYLEIRDRFTGELNYRRGLRQPPTTRLRRRRQLCRIAIPIRQSVFWSRLVRNCGHYTLHLAVIILARPSFFRLTAADLFYGFVCPPTKGILGFQSRNGDRHVRRIKIKCFFVVIVTCELLASRWVWAHLNRHSFGTFSFLWYRKIWLFFARRFAPTKTWICRKTLLLQDSVVWWFP